MIEQHTSFHIWLDNVALVRVCHITSIINNNGQQKHQALNFRLLVNRVVYGGFS